MLIYDVHCISMSTTSQPTILITPKDHDPQNPLTDTSLIELNNAFRYNFPNYNRVARSYLNRDEGQQYDVLSSEFSEYINIIQKRSLLFNPTEYIYEIYIENCDTTLRLKPNRDGSKATEVQIKNFLISLHDMFHLYNNN